MARTARKKSKSGIYHVIIRGIGKQILFEDGQDYANFIKTVARYLSEFSIQIDAYCLMENHVHMLMHDPEDELSQFMKKIEGSYAFYYNHRYERVGTLFQDRYKSEPVDDSRYYATVFRYILQNPMKAGIGKTEEYRWSSYREIVGKAEIITTDYCIEFFGGRKQMLDFVAESNDDVCMEPAAAPIGESRARQILHEQLGIESGTQLQMYDRSTRDDALRLLKQNGLSIRQIERITGINRGIIQKV